MLSSVAQGRKVSKRGSTLVTCSVCIDQFSISRTTSLSPRSLVDHVLASILTDEEIDLEIKLSESMKDMYVTSSSHYYNHMRKTISLPLQIRWSPPLPNIRPIRIQIPQVCAGKKCTLIHRENARWHFDVLGLYRRRREGLYAQQHQNTCTVEAEFDR